jgi:iron complex transport system substrate-binding protein
MSDAHEHCDRPDPPRDCAIFGGPPGDHMSVLSRRACRSVVGATLVAALVAAQSFAQSNAAVAERRPQRIVSLNVCTDQILLRLVEPERIAGVTRLASDPRVSASVDLAAGLPTTGGAAEEVFALEPDLVLAGTYTTRAAVALLRRMDVPVIEIPPESSLADIRRTIALIGDAVGEPERAAAMIERFDAELADLSATASRDRGALADVQVNGWVSGDGTLVADVAHAAGYETLGERLGFGGARQVSLEQLLISAPEAVALADAWGETPALAGERLRHPAVRLVMAQAAVADVPDRLWACGGPFTLEAARRIAAADSGAP